MSNSSTTSSPLVVEEHEAFFRKWAPVLRGCNEMGALDDSLEALGVD